MTPSHWQSLQNLVLAALDLPPEEIPAYLRGVSSGNSELHQMLNTLNTLIKSFEQADSLLPNAIVEYAEEALADHSPAIGERIGPY